MTVEEIKQLVRQCDYPYQRLEDAFVSGAIYVLDNLWVDAQENHLPDIDREVIVIDSRGRISYAHRPAESYTGTSITTGVTSIYYPERYDKGGWNIPDVKYWLDLDLPDALIQKKVTR